MIWTTHIFRILIPLCFGVGSSIANVVSHLGIVLASAACPLCRWWRGTEERGRGSQSQNSSSFYCGPVYRHRHLSANSRQLGTGIPQLSFTWVADGRPGPGLLLLEAEAIRASFACATPSPSEIYTPFTIPYGEINYLCAFRPRWVSGRPCVHRYPSLARSVTVIAAITNRRVPHFAAVSAKDRVPSGRGRVATEYVPSTWLAASEIWSVRKPPKGNYSILLGNDAKNSNIFQIRDCSRLSKHTFIRSPVNNCTPLAMSAKSWTSSSLYVYTVKGQS